MTRIIKVALAGEGAFTLKHLDWIKNIPGIEVALLFSDGIGATRAVAAKYGIPHAITYLDETPGMKEVEAVILATPTLMRRPGDGLHADGQACGS